MAYKTLVCWMFLALLAGSALAQAPAAAPAAPPTKSPSPAPAPAAPPTKSPSPAPAAPSTPAPTPAPAVPCSTSCYRSIHISFFVSSQLTSFSRGPCS
ncbi:hypothetical protein OIU78_020271 [Salix suchowensis]|nr:hypothetical protein OIU78_020271 [Salix suchowensis]